MSAIVYDIAVIGAGPAGMMAAAAASARGASVVLLERNEKAGRKLAITGKGRCNVTNAAELRDMQEQMVSNPRFVISALHRYTNRDVMDFFETQGVPLKIERGGRVFPVSDRAFDIVDALVRSCRRAGVAMRYNTRVSGIHPWKQGWMLTDGKEEYAVKKLIIATGGKSYPVTGSTGDGYRLAESLSHTVVKPRPGLVPLITAERWVPRLQGVSLKNVAVRICHKEQTVYEDFGEMMFTHFGVTGPVILSASSRMQQYLLTKKAAALPMTLHMDLKPALTPEMLDKRLLRDFEKYSRKQLMGSLTDLLPGKLIPVIAELSGIPVQTRADSITKKQRQALGALLKNLTCTITGCRPLEEAIITMGGVDVRQVNPKTMESRIAEGLYFAGEVLDVDALTGGYNLQIAFSTGTAAGKAAAESLIG